MDTLARHLLVELYGCDRQLLDRPDRLRELLREAAAAAGAKPVAEVVHPYSPHGVTAVLLIEESHFSLHTWPEKGYAAADFYTCGDVVPERAASALGRALGAGRIELFLIERGRAASEAPFRVLSPAEPQTPAGRRLVK